MLTGPSRAVRTCRTDSRCSPASPAERTGSRLFSGVPRVVGSRRCGGPVPPSKRKTSPGAPFQIFTAATRRARCATHSKLASTLVTFLKVCTIDHNGEQGNESALALHEMLARQADFPALDRSV